MTIYINDTIKMAIAAEGVPFKDVANAISKDSIKEKATKMFKAIRRDFNVSSPRVAILSFNPEQPGKEENEILYPVVDELAEAGIQTFGPYPSETFFGNGYYGDFDGVIAMYYDQGVPAFKAISTEGIVKFDAGMKIIAVTPDGGAEFDIAGKGIADEATFRDSIYTAIDIYRNRAHYDDPMHNPLQKLYHEKHDDGEKIRFSIPKKRENR
jgi:4-hydroxythreonine-4-phosphate dehydrogenase